MSRLSKTLKSLSIDLLSQIDLITTTGGANEFKKRRITDAWNNTLSPNNPKVEALDNYGRAVVWGYRNVVNRRLAATLTNEEFHLYVYAALKRMNDALPGDFNEEE